MLLIVAKTFLKLPNFRMLIKIKSPPLPRNLALRTFGRLQIMFSTKVNLLYFFYSTKVLSSASDKAKFFTKNFSNYFHRVDSDIPLTVFSSRTNLKLHNISVTPKMVKKVTMNLDSSKSSGPDCI